ncbi:S-layer homology domain-containing protein, partial [Dialister invisus]|uniref:S-layer homology domain-containing protein n=1 Tax=Dialister invisus TaxID=218538 RepID=UPI003C6C32CC
MMTGTERHHPDPFSDVSTDDWAYQAVSDLSDQGVVEGYPDGTFKGERNMTRYELAQVIARLMAREDQLNAEQKATLDKLAGEYADELANLGVRVSNLEKKVGNISWFGDARMRWKEKGYNTDGSRKADGWDGRMRINAKAQVNDSTYVRGRFTSNMNFKDDADADTKMDVLFVHHQFGDKVGMNLGRNFLTLGQTGMYYDDFFDGAQLFIGDS